MEKTIKHIERVRELLNGAAIQFVYRGFVHDESKFDPIEMGPLEEMDALIAREGNVPFGSPEYDARTALLGPMLEHHYANNSHHPEHYENGVSGMDLFDLIEMFVDWKAASERGEESSMNLTAAIKRFSIDEQLASILRNTAERAGWKV